MSSPSQGGVRGDAKRQVGFWGATGVGVGAIVGGGILVLSGAAFEATGPSAILAFLLNGVIAVLTALSFAEMSTAFPESGGAYTFAKKVLSVRLAFVVGWVIWFAYIVAGVLYALGAAEYAVVMVDAFLVARGTNPPAWLMARHTVVMVALAATAFYAVSLVRSKSGGGHWATVGKVILFVVLIAAGLVALAQAPAETFRDGLTPWMPHGSVGFLQAMGFTFIALQGFDLIATIAGEVREPRRVLPRAMLLSLAVALGIYLPLLFVTTTVGRDPGVSIGTMAAARPETLIPDTVRNYLGPAGYWMVMVAAVLSTLSALQANLLASSRVAHTMARDRTLPWVLGRVHDRWGTPVMAVCASSLTLGAILLMVPDLAAAGAAASLIFLVAFALAHLTTFLARRRSGESMKGFRSPWFPAVPIVGGGACVSLALFQAVAVPSAGMIAALWLGLGVMLYYSLFAARAKVVDAYSEAVDPALTRLRGRSPLVLVPVANPASAPAMVQVAAALAPPAVGRVMLMSVLRRGADGDEQATQALRMAQNVVREALTASFAVGQEPETLITVADQPWPEIARVAREHGCESILLGLTHLGEDKERGPRATDLEALLNVVTSDVAILSAPSNWRPDDAGRIVVPIGGRGGHDALRARLLGSLCRTGSRKVVFLRIVPSATQEAERERMRLDLQRFADEETPPNTAAAEVVGADDVIEAVAARTDEGDLVVVGLQRHGGRRLFGEVSLRIAMRTRAATMMLSHQA